MNRVATGYPGLTLITEIEDVGSYEECSWNSKGISNLIFSENFVPFFPCENRTELTCVEVNNVIKTTISISLGLQYEVNIFQVQCLNFSSFKRVLLAEINITISGNLFFYFLVVLANAQFFKENCEYNLNIH